MKAFSLKSDLERHLKTVHEGLGEFKHLDRLKAVGRKGGLDKHVKTVHSRVKEFNCN